MRLSAELLDWLLERQGGDPVEVMSTLCEASAQIIKLSANRKKSRDQFVEYLDKFMALKSDYTIEPERQVN